MVVHRFAGTESQRLRTPCGREAPRCPSRAHQPSFGCRQRDTELLRDLDRRIVFRVLQLDRLAKYVASGESHSRVILPSPTVHSGLRAFRRITQLPRPGIFGVIADLFERYLGRPGRQNAGCQCASGFGGFVVCNENPLKHFSFLLRFQPPKTLTVNLCPAHMRHMPAGAMLPRIRVASHSSKCTAKTTCKRLKISADGTIKVTHCWQLLNNWHSAVKDLGAGGRCDSNSRLDLGQPPKWFM